MGRDKDPTIKTELLENLVNYLLENGLQNLRLRPLAEALGTNARMLIYHFDSKENLISEALTLAQNKQIRLLANGPTPKSDMIEELEYLWMWFTSDDLSPFVKLLFEVEVHALSSNSIYQAFAEQSIHSWSQFVQNRLEGCPPVKAYLIVSTFTGLLLDNLITNDRERVNEVFMNFINLLRDTEIP